MPNLKLNKGKNGIIPDGANKAEKGVYEAGIMLNEISKYASSIGENPKYWHYT